MKRCLLLLVVCVGSTAFLHAQNIASSMANSRPQLLILPDTPQQAMQMPMAVEHSLFEHGGSMSARGERPLWEVMPAVPHTPLGDIAREFRKQHESAPKAVVVWKN